MAGEMMVALALVVPVILVPAAFIWYLNVAGLQAIKEARKEQIAHGKA